jgi:hypothetical protein
MHHGLLQKLAQSGDYYDELNQNIDTPFLLSLDMDHLEEMPVNSCRLGMNEDLPFVLKTHGSLLQQVACGRELKYKKVYISMCQWDPGILSLGGWPMGRGGPT